MKTGIELIAEERAKIFASRGKLEGHATWLRAQRIWLNFLRAFPKM